MGIPAVTTRASGSHSDGEALHLGRYKQEGAPRSERRRASLAVIAGVCDSLETIDTLIEPRCKS